jgi:hypothetical protein
MKDSTSHLLIGNCDEFIFYDDIYQDAVERKTSAVTNIPAEKRRMFDFLLATTQRLLQESRGNLYSSLIKDTMKRKRPDFNEAKYGYATFGDLLEDAQAYGLLDVQRDQKAGGTWVVLGLGKGIAPAVAVGTSSRTAGREPVKKAGSGAEPAATKRTSRGPTKKVTKAGSQSKLVARKPTRARKTTKKATKKTTRKKAGS